MAHDISAFELTAQWGTAKRNSVLRDPVWEDFKRLGREPDLDVIRALFPGTSGKQAFDMRAIEGNMKRLKTNPEVDTGHPFLDLSVKAALAFIDATFQGDHPKYGISSYAAERHDGFPPTIIAVADALSAWGLHERAKELWCYWVGTFVTGDGTIDYYGPSLSEYGMLLHTAALLEERGGADGWWQECGGPLERIAEYLLRLRREAGGGLLVGVPEADERRRPGTFFHNNAWVARGLERWAGLCERTGCTTASSPADVRETAGALGRDTLDAIRATWPADPADWWLSPQTEPAETPAYVTANELSSYTNYRYWPELLSSGILPEDMANRVVESRLTMGGQFCGMTRFRKHLDDWPLADYLYGLWALGRKQEFMMSLYGHVAYHQAGGHLTAYEQVTVPRDRYRGGWEKAGHCIPSQLVAARAARLLQP